MRLVLDTNILIAALIKESITREILVHPTMEYLVSEFIFHEVQKHKEEILQKSGLPSGEFETLFEELKDKLILIPDEEIQFKEKAQEIMRPVDIKDSIFIAIALSTENNGIWSEDKHFEKQNTIQVWKTKDIIEHLKIKHNDKTQSFQASKK